MKTFLIFVGGIVGLCIASVVLMFVLKICPPVGLWPTPPWCKASVTSSKMVLENAISVSTDISKINYPAFYTVPTVGKFTVDDPYCAITTEQVSYPVSYLGEHQMPEVQGAPLPSTIERVIGVKDTWIPEPNLNKACFSLGFTATKNAYEKTLKRVKALGAEKITFTNYVHFSNFKNAEIDGPDKAAVSEEDLRFVANKAREQHLKVLLYLNMAPGKEITSEIPSSPWLSTLIKNWEPFVLHQAKIAQETGIDEIMLNHFDYQPNVRGFENTYNEAMLALLEKVRVVYSGKVLLMIEPLWGADLSKVDPLLRKVDGFIYTPTTDILRGKSDKTVSVDALRPLYLERFAALGRDFGKYDKPIHLRILIQSSKEFLEKGWSEDMFCKTRENDTCYQKNLAVDFSSQAIAYEAIMEAIKQTNGKYFTVAGVESYGYWFTDVVLPERSQPQIAQSIRNKPTESIIKEWFKK